MGEQRVDTDSLSVVILLARFDQAVSGVLIKLAEHQSGVGSFPSESLQDLADQMTWMAEAIRQRVAVSGDATAAGRDRQVEQP